MVDVSFELSVGRDRVGWIVFFCILAIAAAYIAYSFVGLIVLGVFGYYATRPIYARMDGVIDSDSIVAGLTVLLVLVPIVALTFYAGFQIFQHVQTFLGSTDHPLGLISSYLNVSALPVQQQRKLASAFQNPRQFVTNPQQTLRTVFSVGVKVVSALISTLVFVGLAISLSYFLLQNDDDISGGLRRLFGGKETTAYAYATAVDKDLESVFFGNLLFVLAMSVVAAIAYWGTNALAPEPLHVPMIFVLAFLTGVASLIPIVVGKLVYLPVVGYLGLQSVQAGGDHLVFVGVVLVAYFLVLDILPQTFLQPYITGRKLDMMILMFAYILGPILFGWYGFFFLPIIFIVMLEAVRIPLSELVHGETLTPTVTMGESFGASLDGISGDSTSENETTSDRDPEPSTE